MKTEKQSSKTILVIGGTSAYHLELNEYGRIEGPFKMSTNYGESSDIILLTTEKGKKLYFISRHGLSKLELIPSGINFASNIEAARLLGVNRIFSWNGVGAINRLLSVDDLVIPAALIDFTKTRSYSLNDPGLSIKSPQAFDEKGRRALFSAAKKKQSRVFSGVYVCTEGPRLETKSEISMFSRFGCDIVGMTLSPEAWMAKEAGIAYASLAIITNLATGVEIENRRKTNFSKEVGQLGMDICLEASNIIMSNDN